MPLEMDSAESHAFRADKLLKEDDYSKAALEADKVRLPSTRHLFSTGFSASDYDAAVIAFQSPLVYSCALGDLKNISATISRVARIDRLPTTNSPEAMRMHTVRASLGAGRVTLCVGLCVSKRETFNVVMKFSTIRIENNRAD